VSRVSLLISLSFALLLAAVPASGSGASAASASPVPAQPAAAKVVVVGDSISASDGGARYRVHGAPGAKPEVWWSHVVRHWGVRPGEVLDLAVGGTGYVTRGRRDLDGRMVGACRGTRFDMRLQRLEAARPDVVIVAGGRNDARRCSGTRVPTTAAERARRVREFDTRLLAVTRRLGIPASRVYVTVPWGSTAHDDRAEMSALVERNARRVGFTYVPVDALRPVDLIDTSHPDASGTVRLARDFERASGIGRALAAASVLPGRVQRTSSGTCTTAEQGDARATTWGRRGSVGFVAGRLARTASAPLAPPSSRTSVLQSLMAAGAQVVSVPRAGDVAWWAQQPWTRSDREHVGVVLRRSSAGTTVTEVRAGLRCERTTYASAGVPRAYLRVPRTGGSPRGEVTGVSAGARSVRVAGWVADPDARPSARTRLEIIVRAGSAVVGRAASPAGYRYSVSVPLPRAVRGKHLQVRVVARDAGRGHDATVGRTSVRAR
jgi:lysophospholipase L1-like esterase